jgi:hypothetical protein
MRLADLRRALIEQGALDEGGAPARPGQGAPPSVGGAVPTSGASSLFNGQGALPPSGPGSDDSVGMLQRGQSMAQQDAEFGL